MIVSAGDDDHGRSHGHNREETGVGGGLKERIGAKEIIDGLAGEPVTVRSGEQRKDQAESEDHEHQPGGL